MLETVILAGGKSSRFKQNKMSSLINGLPILRRTIETFLDVSDRITIVTGYYDVSYLEDFIKEHNINVVHNELHEQGMFSSIKKGISNIEGDLLLIPGDYPFIQKATIKTLLRKKGQIKVPTYKGRKGHPIFISKQLLPSLKQEPLDSNLKLFRNRHDVNYVEVYDEGILLDVDYKEDIKRNAERNE